MIPRLSNRAKVDRWIAKLTPMFEVITSRINMLNLGQAHGLGPLVIRSGSKVERIRKGAVWFVSGKNCGFHVDFCSGGVEIEAWTGSDRRSRLWISGKVTEVGLKKDLTVLLVAAGLTDLARTEQVRENLFSRTGKQ